MDRIDTGHNTLHQLSRAREDIERLDLLVETVRVAVDGILEGKNSVKIIQYGINATEKVKVYSLKNLVSKEKEAVKPHAIKESVKHDIHAAIESSRVGIKDNKIPTSLVWIRERYNPGNISHVPMEQILSDMKVVLGVLFFMSTYGSPNTFLKRVSSAIKNPMSHAYDGSDSDRTLKAILVYAQRNLNKTQYNIFIDKLTIITKDIVNKYQENILGGLIPPKKSKGNKPDTIETRIKKEGKKLRKRRGFS